MVIIITFVNGWVAIVINKLSAQGRDLLEVATVCSTAITRVAANKLKWRGAWITIKRVIYSRHSPRI